MREDHLACGKTMTILEGKEGFWERSGFVEFLIRGAFVGGGADSWSFELGPTIAENLCGFFAEIFLRNVVGIGVGSRGCKGRRRSTTAIGSVWRTGHSTRSVWRTGHRVKGFVFFVLPVDCSV